MYKVLIVGANFINKGAQSMLFITMDEIRRRMPDAEIYFATFEGGIDTKQYRFKTVYYSPQAVSIALSPYSRAKVTLQAHIKNTVKWVAGSKYRKYRVPVGRFTELAELISEINLVIDISGFGLGAKWGIEGSEQYLNNIRLARKYSIPMLLMPQSFGPFDYSGKKSRQIVDDIREVLQYPQKIFAREIQGYNILTNEIGLNNVVMSCDLVLQNQGVKYDNIFCEEYSPADLTLPTRGNVAVIPNVQCFRHGNRKFIFELYKAIIEQLRKRNKIVYIVSHATEDMEICGQIKDLFAGEKNVHLYPNDLSCLEFDGFVKEFDYIICSRFHGAVHAYRNRIPCIILGWAIKYSELSKAVGQEKYCFDITSTEEGLQEAILDRICRMDEVYIKETENIAAHLSVIRSENCFDSLDLR